ncbi:unnamed protein product, partial [Phaeothamnion confervicola]
MTVQDRCVITDPRAVELLFDLRASRMLAPFISSEHTLSTASVALGVAPSTLAHWIPKFVRTGLLVPTRVEARKGAPMRWYRTPGASLFVPIAAVPAATRMEFLGAGRQRVLDLFVAGMDERVANDASTGVSFTSTGPVGVDVDLEPAPAQRDEPWTEFWGTLDLTRSQAHALAEELAAVVSRYRALEGGP